MLPVKFKLSQIRSAMKSQDQIAEIVILLFDENSMTRTINSDKTNIHVNSVHLTAIII